MRIKLTKKQLIDELVWCLDMVYPLEYKKKVFNCRVSLKNRKLMAKGIYALLSAHIEKGDL